AFCCLKLAIGFRARSPRIVKAKGAFVSESALHILMAISRILSQHFASKILGMIIYLSRISPRVRRTFIRRDATIPEDQSSRLPCLCFVLHRMGFFMPHELLRKR